MKSSSLVTFAAGFVAGSVLLGGTTVAYAAYVRLSDDRIGVLPNSTVNVYCVTKDSVARPYKEIGRASCRERVSSPV